jgi:hypothetical protein
VPADEIGLAVLAIGVSELLSALLAATAELVRLPRSLAILFVLTVLRRTGNQK